ncbi:MAG: hypothetical protein KGL39_28890 [Patescibacteria group bacterium]|nr:hypothetical protein [Patescibacteria group bacterium]
MPTLSPETLDTWWAAATPRERDAAVAEHVLGYRAWSDGENGWFMEVPEDNPSGWFGGPYPLPRFCDEIKEAWWVVESMCQRNLTFHLDETPRGWVVQFNPGAICPWGDGVAATAPEAICLAAMKVMLEKRPS